MGGIIATPEHSAAEPPLPDRLRVAVGVVMDRYGLDDLGAFRWIVDESHRARMPIGDIVSELVAAKHDEPESSGDPRM